MHGPTASYWLVETNGIEKKLETTALLVAFWGGVGTTV